MTDSDDDFVEVSGYQSSDSDWEKIDDSRSNTSDENNHKKGLFDTDDNGIVQSYYRSDVSPVNNKDQYGQDQEVPVSNNNGDLDHYNSTSSHSSTSSKRSNNSKNRKKQWSKMLMKRGQGAPYDPVDYLGITASEKSLLSHFGVTTIGQLAYFNALEFVSSTEPDKFAIILDLQERAYETVSEYVTKSSAHPEVVWGYSYLGDTAIARLLKKGYLDSDSLYFVWTPMPALMYQNQLAIDNLIGRESSDHSIRDRYSRFVKINLSKLCDKYYGRLYQKDPNRMQNKWIPTTLLEAADLAQREDLWFTFEAGNDLYSNVNHGSVVIPTGRIPRDCLELDSTDCKFSVPEGYESEEDESVYDVHPTVMAHIDRFL